MWRGWKQGNTDKEKYQGKKRNVRKCQAKFEAEENSYPNVNRCNENAKGMLKTIKDVLGDHRLRNDGCVLTMGEEN